MNKCHECGSELSDIDAFCPYCGISLQPVGATVSEAEFNEDAEASLQQPDAVKTDVEEFDEFAPTIVVKPATSSVKDEVYDQVSAQPNDYDEAPAENFVDSEPSVESAEELDSLAQFAVDQSSDDSPKNDEWESIGSEPDSAEDETDAEGSVAPEAEAVNVDLVSASSIAEPSINDELESKSDAFGTADESEISDDFSKTIGYSETDRKEILSVSESYREDKEFEIEAKGDALESSGADEKDFEGTFESSKSEIANLPNELEREAKQTEREQFREVFEAGDAENATNEPSEFMQSDDAFEAAEPQNEVEPEMPAVPSTDERAEILNERFEASAPVMDPLEGVLPAAIVSTDPAIHKDVSESPAESPEESLEARGEVVDTGEESNLADEVAEELESSSVQAENAEASPDLVDAQDTPADAESAIVASTSAISEVEDTDGSNKRKLTPIAEGTVLNNRYEIVRKIGGGGMGAVYLANDKNLGGILRAVKEMVQSYIEIEQQEKAIADFKRETMLLTTLEHPSIPTIFDYFFDKGEGRFYLVMKYIAGGDLAGKLRSAPGGKLDEKTVVEWGIQIADVLEYLHSRNPAIVYRDLKPANVMIDANSNRIMLIDFGIARWVNKEEKGVTAVGTMGYAPPELFSGNVEPRSDIYSLGSTMFHLLTGANPQSNPLLIFDFQKNPRPRQINSALSDQIEQILMRAVEYNADKRFESAAQMKSALIEHLKRLSSGAVTYGALDSSVAVGLANEAVFCGFCGQKIVATDMFCAFCGAKQPMAQPGVHSEQYLSAPVTAQLYVEGTSELDSPNFMLVKDDNMVGRRDPISNIFPEVDLSKFDPQTKISRRHARIWRDRGKFFIEDLASSNGTIVIEGESTKRLGSKESYMLKSGSKVQLGDTVLRFLIG
ncbi:MAG: protein kinase domain-containing protein [Pyrinomonadaceae bacterium]